MPPAAALAALHAGAEALWQRTAPVWPTLTVEVLPRIDSTNAELMRRARAGQTEPVVLTALEQTAGRGRAGRPWITPPGAALALSVGCWLNPADWSGLSLAVGVAVAEALGPAVQLKWPNDLWWRQRKVGGILIETANVPGPGPGRWCVAGIGLNGTAPDLPANASAHAVPPAGLREAEQAGELPAWPLARLLEAVGYAVLHALTAFERAGLAPFLPRYAARDALAGRALCLSDGTHGVADGVAADGSLRLLTANGTVHVHQGDVSVRPC
ncbi:biotin--[acetyl-CoA-carboxylase] ligase [Tepidimonas charontis]|uniref:Bifunctional ligase/repressor BirA n=1 Tax=Tepidimonas charontis TaxID=2267262 RepID=A0A554XCG6_9BURK|nr:biotin--[acetyl-CoA-carboxylase] ligase [Tepidimonas charontis]TSE33444.1 Bifunctional ligase/repressor BirA [Tepidimonas charontis]